MITLGIEDHLGEEGANRLLYLVPRPPEVAERWRGELRFGQRVGLQKEFNLQQSWLAPRASLSPLGWTATAHRLANP